MLTLCCLFVCMVHILNSSILLLIMYGLIDIVRMLVGEKTSCYKMIHSVNKVVNAWFPGLINIVRIILLVGEKISCYKMIHSVNKIVNACMVSR